MLERNVRTLVVALMLAATTGLLAGSSASAVSPPPNDNLANAAPVGTLPATKFLDTSFATSQPAEPHSFCGKTASVWYKFTPASTFVMRVDTLHSAYNANVAVWAGSTFGHLHLVGCSYDISDAAIDSGTTSNTQAMIAFTAHAGVRYSIQVTSAGVVGGNLQLRFLKVTPPANDNLAQATPIAAFPFSTSVTNHNATTQAHEQNTCGTVAATRWYSVTASRNTTLRADTFGSDFDTAIAVYTGSSINNLVLRACDDATDHNGKGVDLSSLTWPVRHGVQYFIQVGGYQNQTGDLHLHVQRVGRPANDDFANATQIGSLPASLQAGNRNATHQQGEPRSACADLLGLDQSRWYAYTATSSASLKVEVIRGDPGMLPYVAVYTGNSLGTLTEVGCAGAETELDLSPTNGTTYFFQVAGFADISGPMTFNLDFGP
jgi:hypothetical protein